LELVSPTTFSTSPAKGIACSNRLAGAGISGKPGKRKLKGTYL
jgi:hypothetical protein